MHWFSADNHKEGKTTLFPSLSRNTNGPFGAVFLRSSMGLAHIRL